MNDPHDHRHHHQHRHPVFTPCLLCGKSESCSSSANNDGTPRLACSISLPNFTESLQDESLRKTDSMRLCVMNDRKQLLWWILFWLKMISKSMCSSQQAFATGMLCSTIDSTKGLIRCAPFCPSIESTHSGFDSWFVVCQIAFNS